MSADIKTKHDAVALPDEFSFDGLEKSIVNMEKFATVFEANGCINDVYTSIVASQGIKSASNYGGNRSAELQAEYNRINSLNVLASTYSAYNGSISQDIDGNDVREDVGGVLTSISIDYLSEAWPVLQKRIAELEAAAMKFASDVVTLSYIVGDADNDKQITINDYSVLRSWVLEDVKYEDVSESQRYAADVKGDNQFTVSDMNSISNLIFGIENAPLAKSFGAAGANEVSLSKLSENVSAFDKTVRVAVELNNSNAMSSGQFDVQLPAGMKLVGQELTERSNGHDLFANQIGDGLYRVLASTIENKEFCGSNGALVVLDIEVVNDYQNGTIELSNVIFSDIPANTYRLAAYKAGSTTGIDSITAATAKECIYSVGGQVLKTLKKGINILVGEDGKSHKVVKK